MANEDYIFTYKCRYCGETFGDSITGSKSLATSWLIQTACDLPKNRNHPGDMAIHYTANHIGIADLVGCEIKGKSKCDK